MLYQYLIAIRMYSFQNISSNILNSFRKLQTKFILFNNCLNNSVLSQLIFLKKKQRNLWITI